MDVANGNPGAAHFRDEVGGRCQKLFQDFIEEFKEDGNFKYIEPAKELLKQERSTIEVSFEDVERFNQNLATTIIEEYYRVYPYLCQAVSNFVKDRGNLKKPKECYVSFVDVPTRHKLRQLRSEKIGTLLRISGQVIRTHPVHPELVLGTFLCLDCQTITKDIEQQFKFTYPTVCRNPMCNNRHRFMLDVDKSTFVDFQKVKIQETQHELPRGCIPRALEVILREENVETVQAGDRYDFTGTYIVVPDVGALSKAKERGTRNNLQKRGVHTEGVRGLRALGIRDLEYSTAFLACSLQPTNPRFGGVEMPLTQITPEIMRSQMSEEEWKHMYEMSHDRNLYTNLIHSLFPGIHGNDEVKRGILLMLLGGVTKHTEEGTTLRGDINCCIVGDPSTAKSQFLKQVSEFWPRSVYTSGKASSAAGLTAAVVHDEESTDFVIEAGALMLADNGVCCIDEFDKMDPRDQVAIHEAMEQQTISIAKAGVRASLNARASILAAANPIGGRYDRARSLQQNIALSAPIMSRFDLFFILVDEGKEVIDYAIAQKILDLHRNIEDTTQQIYKEEEILQYLNFAKKFQPILSDEAESLLVKNYMNLRLRDATSGRSSFRITVRQLESMIRLAEAMAKLEISEEVKTKHVEEAYRLLNKSIIRVEQPEIHFDDDDDANQALEGALAQENLNTTGDSVAEEMNEMSLAAKTKLVMNFEEYRTLSNKIVVYMRKEEERRDACNESGLRRSDIIEWYLSMIMDELEGEDDLIRKKQMIEKVLDRLMYHDQVIVPLIPAGVKGDAKTEEQENPMVVVHPNYVLD